MSTINEELELFPVMPEDWDEPQVADAYDEGDLVEEVPQENLTKENLLEQIAAWEKAYGALQQDLDKSKRDREKLMEIYQEATKDFNKNLDEAGRVINAFGDFNKQRWDAFFAIMDGARTLINARFEMPEPEVE